MNFPEKYESLLKLISPNKWKYLHYKSLNNFILQLSNDMSIDDKDDLDQKLRDFFEIIGEDDIELDGQTGIEIFEKYINPIGQTLKKYGFKKITPMKYLILYSIMTDSLIFLAFYPFPYPILTVIAICYSCTRMKLFFNSNKVFGVFY